MARVLIIDDEEAILRVLGTGLRARGYDVDTATAGAAGLSRAVIENPDVVVLDLRDEEVIHPTNRFTLYAVFPQCNLSIHVLWGLKQQNTVFAMGKSVLDRSSAVDVGTLMLARGGGGHAAAGTCQVPNDQAAAALAELIAETSGLPESRAA